MQTGVTDSGLTYHVVTAASSDPPIVLEVEPPERKRWGQDAPHTMVGQSFGMRWRGRLLLLRVVAAQLNAENGRLRLTCR